MEKKPEYRLTQQVKIYGWSCKLGSSSLKELLTTAGLIEDSVKLGAMTPQEAFNAFQELEAQLIELEKNINVWAARNYKNWIDGGKDNLVDIRNARLQLQLKRQALIAAISKPQNI